MAENYMCKSAAAKGISMATVAVSFIRTGWHPHIKRIIKTTLNAFFHTLFCFSPLLFMVKVKHEGAERLPTGLS